MDAQTLKDDIAWFHGFIAGMLNSEYEDEETLRFLLDELNAASVLLGMVEADSI